MSQEMDMDCSEKSAADKVFGIVELREEILKYVIYDNEGKLSGKMVGNARVVQKSWFETTTKLLRKVKQPVIQFTLDGDAKDVKVKGLVDTFGATPRLLGSFLPVKLHLKREFFHERNYPSLSDCLTRLGNDVVEICVDYPKDGGTMPVTLKMFSLPHLKQLTFKFSHLNLKDDINGEDVFGDNRNGLGLLQSILNASSDITNLILPYNGVDDVVPGGFKYLQLPVTITFLELKVELKSKDLEVLLNNQLPNLSHLTLMVDQVPFQDGLLFKILKQFQKTLETLEILGFMSFDGAKPHTHLRFPLMEKLTRLNINCTECELGPEEISALQNCFPELTDVKLLDHPEASLAKWTKDSRFEKVEELTVSVVNEQLDSDNEFYYMSPGPTTLSQLHQTFPNICNLSLTVNVSDLTSLKYLFQDMVQLKTLKIFFFGDGAVLDNSSDLIDSTLLGLPLRLVVALKENMELLETQTIIIKGGLQPSIRNLSELVTLTLETETIPDSDLDENGKSLISDILFRYAFKEMTTLRNLHLHKKFKPSLEMQNEWSGQGRLIKYYNV